MTTRFLHVGDVHLQHASPRNADRLASLDQILAAGLRLEALGAWLIPGDLFHARSTVEDRNALATRLQAAAERAPVVLVRGNHDQPGDLEIFARLKARWPVYLATRPQVLTVPLPTGATAAIACLPYPDRFGLVAAGVAPGDVVPTAADMLDVIFMELAQALAEAVDAGAIPLFLGHANIRGAIASTGQPQIGMEIEIDRAMLERLPAVYCGLNHIHKPQEVGVGVFAGSIAAMDHGETEPKSYVLIEVRSRETLAVWRRVRLDTPTLHHVEGVLTREGFTLSPIDGVHYNADGLDWTGCDVRVRYRYKASDKDALDHAGVRALFASALRLKVEPIAEPDRALRSEAVAEARSLADKVRAYAEHAGVAMPDDVLEKLARLEHIEPAPLLMLVERALAAMTRLGPPDDPAPDDAPTVPQLHEVGR